MAQDIFAPKSSFDIGYEKPLAPVTDNTEKIRTDFQALALGAQARAVQGQASLERTQASAISAGLSIAADAYSAYDSTREKSTIDRMLAKFDAVDQQDESNGMSYERKRAEYGRAIQEAAASLSGGYRDLAKYNTAVQAATGLSLKDMQKTTEQIQFENMQNDPVFQTAYLASKVYNPTMSEEQRVVFAQNQAAESAAANLMATTANANDATQWYTKGKPATLTRLKNLDSAIVASIQIKRDSGQPITTLDIEGLEARVAEAKRFIDLSVPNSLPESERTEISEYFSNLDGFLTQLKDTSDPDKIATGVASYLAQTGNTMADVIAGATITKAEILTSQAGLGIFKNLTDKLSDGSQTAALTSKGDLGGIFDSLLEARQGEIVGPNTIMTPEELDVVFSSKGLTAQDLMQERETGLGLIKDLDVSDLATDQGKRQLVGGLASVIKSLNNLDLQQTGTKLNELVVESGLIDKLNMLDSYDKATANQIRTLLNSAVTNNLRFSEAKIQSIETSAKGYTNRNPELVWDEAEQVYYATNQEYIRQVGIGMPEQMSMNMVNGKGLRLPKGSDLASYGDIPKAYKHREVVDAANKILGQTMVEEEDTTMVDVGGTPAPERLEVLEFIKTGEGNYDSSNRGTVNNEIVGTQLKGTTRGGKLLTEMTLGDIKRYQKIKDPNNPNRLFAVGAYQITPDAMDAAMKAAGVNDNTIFSPAVQDRMGLGLMIGSKRPKLAAYIKGESDDLNAAMLDFAREWASVPDPRTGQSYYKDSGNAAKHTVEETRQALQRARQAYSSGIVGEELPPVRDAQAQNIIDTAQQAIDQSSAPSTSPRPQARPTVSTVADQDFYSDAFVQKFNDALSKTDPDQTFNIADAPYFNSEEEVQDALDKGLVKEGDGVMVGMSFYFVKGD